MRVIVSEEERAAQYDWSNFARRYAFAKTDVPPEWVCNDLDPHHRVGPRTLRRHHGDDCQAPAPP